MSKPPRVCTSRMTLTPTTQLFLQYWKIQEKHKVVQSCNKKNSLCPSLPLLLLSDIMLNLLVAYLSSLIAQLCVTIQTSIREVLANTWVCCRAACWDRGIIWSPVPHCIPSLSLSQGEMQVLLAGAVFPLQPSLCYIFPHYLFSPSK